MSDTGGDFSVILFFLSLLFLAVPIVIFMINSKLSRIEKKLYEVLVELKLQTELKEMERPLTEEYKKYREIWRSTIKK